MGQLITSENKDMMVSWMYTWSRQQEMSIHEQRKDIDKQMTEEANGIVSRLESMKHNSI